MEQIKQIFALKGITNLSGQIAGILDGLTTNNLGDNAASRPSRRAKTIAQAMLTTHDEDMGSDSKRPKQDNIPKSRLMVRARGFEGIYDESLPLDILSRFIDRHKYSTSTGGLHFYTDLIRGKAMRGAWKLSSAETVSLFLSQMGELSLEDS